MILSFFKRLFGNLSGQERGVVMNYPSYTTEVFVDGRGWVSYNELHGVIKNG